jgi:hypothetical protein
MDKIISAEEWRLKNHYKICKWSSGMVKEYSTYLLDKFAKEVKSKKYEVDNFNTAVAVEDIDNLLTKFKDKL